MEASFQHLSVIFLSDVSCTLKTAYMKTYPNVKVYKLKRTRKDRDIE